MSIKLPPSIALQKDSLRFSLSKLLMRRLCPPFTCLSLPHRDNCSTPIGGNCNDFPDEDFTIPPRARDHLGKNLPSVQLAELSHHKRGKTAEKGCQAPSDVTSPTRTGGKPWTKDRRSPLGVRLEGLPYFGDGELVCMKLSIQNTLVTFP